MYKILTKIECIYIFVRREDLELGNTEKYQNFVHTSPKEENFTKT